MKMKDEAFLPNENGPEGHRPEYVLNTKWNNKIYYYFLLTTCKIRYTISYQELLISGTDDK